MLQQGRPALQTFAADFMRRVRIHTRNNEVRGLQKDDVLILSAAGEVVSCGSAFSKTDLF